MSARLYLLAVGAFAIGTTAYVITGLIPAISSELGVTTAVAGQLATAFALAYAVGAPLVASVTGRWNRRTLLVTALSIAAVGNLVSALAPVFGLLLAGRVIAALGAAAFTPTAIVVATGLVPAEKRGRAVATVFGGLTVAMAIGVPAAGLLAPLLGFRGVHAVLTALCALIGIGIVRMLPSVPAPNQTPLRERLSVAADRRAIKVLALSIIGVTATMIVYIYLVPILAVTADVGRLVASGSLLIYGVGAIIGNSVGGRMADRYGPRRVLPVILIAFTVLVMTLPFTATTVVGAGIVLFLWGGFGWGFNPPIQTLLVDIGRERASLLVSLNASAIYLGAGIAGGLGGVVINQFGPLALPVVSSGLAVAGLALGMNLVFARDRESVRQAA